MRTLPGGAHAAEGVVRVVATIFTGLAAGIFLGHRMGVSFAMPHLSPSSFVQLQQVIRRHFARMMPPLILTALGASLAWAVLLASHGRSLAFWLAAGAALALVCIAALTRGVNVPINQRLVTWSTEVPPADLITLWTPWSESIQRGPC